MKCVICHSPEVETMKVNEEIRIHSDIVLVPITIPICMNCGERYYDRSTMLFLEQTKEKLEKKSVLTRQVGVLLELAD